MKFPLSHSGALLLCFLALPGLAQQQPFPLGEARGNWRYFDPALRLDPLRVFEQYPAAWGLGPADRMELLRVDQDELGFSHHRFQLFHGAYPVEGAIYLIHSRQGRAESSNGYLPAPPALPASQQALSAAQARQIALAHLAAARYAWEDAAAEAQLRRISGNPATSFYPQPELLIADADFNPQTPEAWRLAWKVDVYALQPLTRQWIYVDARSGEVFKSLETLHSDNAPGIAETRYHGTRSITTDSSAIGYRLREQGRGLGVAIETYDLNRSTSTVNAVDFTDSDNYWDHANADFDDAATDAHWGAEVTYDYFLQRHSRNSFDNQGAPILSYVHYDSAYFNAFWNGAWMTFGDGNGDPLTPLDIVAHEFTHGVTQFTAGLYYAYESGALNESFSDIFGNAVEFENDTAQADWRIAERLGSAFRSMERPRDYGNPESYRGSFWSYGTFDNGGVHINSGVQNRWFYLLVNGGSGVNDQGRAFAVQGIGLQKAAQIAYRNLAFYLTPTSQYADAREGSIQAAVDLFGKCSPEYQAVVNAWHAVQLGEPVRENDFGVEEILPLEACALGSEEQLTIRIRYYGCDTLPPGQLLVAFTRDPFDFSGELLDHPLLAGGESFLYTFAQTTDLSQPGIYRFISRTARIGDPYSRNDSSDFYYTYNTAPFTEGSLDFEAYTLNSLNDSLYLEAGSQARIEIEPGAGKNGSKGIRMEGGNRDRFTFIEFLPPGEDVFPLDPEYKAKACFCYDARNLKFALLSFDLRQTYSPLRELSLAMDSLRVAQQVNTLRLTLDGSEIARYHPRSHQADPFTNQMINLTPYVGGMRQLCFEGRMNTSRVTDLLGIGEQILLDNINLQALYIPTRAGEELGNAFRLFPNPAQELLILRSETPARCRFLVSDAAGRVLFEGWHEGSETQIPLERLAPGFYLLRIEGEEGFWTERFFKQ
jgi:Zn-dependent metalloprotease